MFVRWSGQAIVEEERRQLPGYRDAVVRHFEAPEAVDTRFYEVRAKSVLNGVPEASRMPFRWTVNPYRGCSHACAYCMEGDTHVLLADGRNRKLRDLEVGEAIVGTARHGRYRRYVATRVLAKWSSIREAHEIELADGIRIVASEDHRFLTSRGWKHVTGAEQGRPRRPHLTRGGRLLGPGGHAEAPEHDLEYRLGYLCGMVRGDADLASYSYERVGRAYGDVHRFRLALTDIEALDRAERFLRLSGVGTSRSEFLAATGADRQMFAIRNSSAGGVERIRQLTAWPQIPTTSWLKGFLGGIFDAEGGSSYGVVRISSTDPLIIAWIVRGLELLGFAHRMEPQRDKLNVVRLLGGSASTWRSERTPIRTSGSRAATS